MVKCGIFNTWNENYKETHGKQLGTSSLMVREKKLYELVMYQNILLSLE